MAAGNTVLGELANHWHGKARVRMLKTTKTDKMHQVLELTCRITLWGAYDHVYTKGDNTDLVATDTMKNTVYIVAQKHGFSCLEQFGLLLTKHFLDKYSMLNSVKVELQQHTWQRVVVDGKEHTHGFMRARNDYPRAEIHRTRGEETKISSGIVDLVVLKTTKSGFQGFLRDENTSLPETDDRLLSTSVAADWTYTTDMGLETDYNEIHDKVRTALIESFFGPADGGTYSNSVQETLFQMANKVLAKVPAIKDITLDMPNIHFLPLKTMMTSHGLGWTGEVHLPTDEPHGTICATVRRSKL